MGFSQTCIIAYSTSNAIYFGADSRTKNYIFETSKWISSNDACKIRSVNGFHFLLSGSGSEQLPEIAKKELKSIDDFKKYIDAVYVFYINKLRSIQAKDFEYYKASYPKGKVFIECYVGFFEEDTPVVVNIFLEIKNGERELVEIRIKMDPNYPSFLAFAGESAEAQKYYSQSKLLAARKPEKYIQDLIKKQAKKTPDKVREPISIFKITSKKAAFIYPGHCK